MDAGMRDKTVLVTGASGGLGNAIARALAAEGASLVLHAHESVADAEALARDLDVPTCVVKADVADEAQVDAMWARALATFRIVHGLVVNAGIWIPEAVPVHEMTLAQWRLTLGVDLTGAFLTCRGFLRHLGDVPRAEAAIVLVGSTAGLFGEADHADYAAAKAGLLHGLLPSLKNEIVHLAPEGRVNAVAPGWILTPMAERALADPDDVVRQTRTVAMRKVARPEEVASTVAFLLSPKLAGHVTGAVLPVHGGMEGRLLHP